MTTYGKIPEMTEGQKNEIVETFIGAIPKLNFYQAKVILDNKSLLVSGFNAAFKQYLDSKPTAVSAPRGIIPAEGVDFELTIESIDPMEMVRIDGYNPAIWKFIGSRVTPQTRFFKLVRVGYCANFSEVRAKLSQHGSIPKGQWREAFKRAFPKNDGQWCIGFADPSWVNLGVDAKIPALNKDGNAWGSDFYSVSYGYNENWRWLVESKPACR